MDKGATGATGATGPSGHNCIFYGSVQILKLASYGKRPSGQPIKRWDGSRWVIHLYRSRESGRGKRSVAIVANLGTVTAGLIKSKGWTTFT
ncbi:hypothetical protein [Mediterraneibacter gnavus]|uniref:hypothetical protein n=1 Tax=Mediterraneibacter gnavus TaxID=33038 RepID=UPI00093D3E31|nr:hypothetical protein [Mediterraneibacter gnavus]